MVVKSKRYDLKDIQGRLKDQMHLCQEEIGLGSRWGSRIPDAPELTLPPAQVAAGLQHVEDLLKGVDGEIHLQQQSGEWGEQKGKTEPSPSSEKILPGSASQAAVDAFLDGMPETTGQSTKEVSNPLSAKDSDLDSILASFEEH